jgi:hypothetical protein
MDGVMIVWIKASGLVQHVLNHHEVYLSTTHTPMYMYVLHVCVVFQTIARNHSGCSVSAITCIENFVVAAIGRGWAVVSSHPLNMMTYDLDCFE